MQHCNTPQRRAATGPADPADPATLQHTAARAATDPADPATYAPTGSDTRPVVPAAAEGRYYFLALPAFFAFFAFLAFLAFFALPAALRG